MIQDKIQELQYYTVIIFISKSSDLQATLNLDDIFLLLKNLISTYNSPNEIFLNFYYFHAPHSISCRWCSLRTERF